jgi:four helix bundle protein
MHNFRELKIWQKSRDFVKEVYSFTAEFPDKEKYVLVSQINRSAISISSNIAEGSGRNGTQDFQRFLDIAIGSAFELESQLVIANDLDYINNESLAKLTSKVQEIQKMIRGFRHHIEKSKV